MPLQYMLTAEAQRRIGRSIQVEGADPKNLSGTPVGQIVGRMNTIPSCRDLIYDMVNEYIETTTRVSELTPAEEKAK